MQKVRELVLMRSEQIGQKTHRFDLGRNKLAKCSPVFDILCDSGENRAVGLGLFMGSLLRASLELESCLDPGCEFGNIVRSQCAVCLKY